MTSKTRPGGKKSTLVILIGLALITIAACSQQVDIEQTQTAEPATAASGIPLESSGATPISPVPTPTRLPIDGETWILDSVDGQPLINGTYATLTINGPQLGGFDGCNSFGGRHESGNPVVNRNGGISVPPFARTAAGCPTPEILEQANRYLGSMKDQAKARVSDDRLHIVDRSGEVALVFIRQQPLTRQPGDLTGTSWRLVDHDATYGEPPATLVFLNSWAAVGTTACRDYQMGYSASNGRIRIPSTGMAGFTEPCSGDAKQGETQFVEDFGWASEYAIPRVKGSDQLVVRTNRGRTLTFEALAQPAGAIFDQSWRLIRFLEARSDGSSMRWLTDRDPAPSTAITAMFSETAIKGSLGCYSYEHRRVGGDGAPTIGSDGTMNMDALSPSTENSCANGTGISAQQQQYLDLVATAERYHVFKDRLVIVTSSGNALMFQSDTNETTIRGDLFSRLSPQERQCLGPEITSDRDIFAMLSTSPTTGTQAIRCLNKENQFQPYMSNDPGPENLNEATHRCIWNSMEVLLDLDSRQPDPPDESSLMGQMMTMMMVMPLYCATTHQPELEADALGFDEEEAPYIICAIDSLGGPEAWIETLKESGPSFDAFIQAEDICGGTTPQP